MTDGGEAAGPASTGGHRAAGFFTLRTPLLPFAELEAWSADLEGPQVAADGLPPGRAGGGGRGPRGACVGGQLQAEAA